MSNFWGAYQYVVLISVNTHAYKHDLTKTYPQPRLLQNKTARRSPKEQVKLILLWSFAECGNHKALRLKAQGVYSCK